MTTSQDWELRRKRWAEYKARVAARKAKAETFTCNCYQCHTGNKHVGDGESGFDYWHDTHRHC